MNLTLVILAAGMGSRYGGLKQLDGIGPAGEIIMDYSIRDALQAGFTRFVLIIRKDFEEQMRQHLTSQFGDSLQVDFIFQELNALPDGLTSPEERTKPWGTGHALWLCRERLDAPFGIINADDFYGADAYTVLADWLRENAAKSGQAAIISYALANTLSDHGAVSRGICRTSETGNLLQLDERSGVRREDDRILCEANGDASELAPDSAASMNLFGFLPDFSDELDRHVRLFFKEFSGELKSECFLPLIVSEMVHAGTLVVEVRPTEASWMGVTFPEDRALVAARLAELTTAGLY